MNFDRINESDIETTGYNEFVTFVDKQAETAIKDVIQSRYPEHGIIAEESKPKESDGCDYVWIIDPPRWDDELHTFLSGVCRFYSLKSKGFA